MTATLPACWRCYDTGLVLGIDRYLTPQYAPCPDCRPLVLVPGLTQCGCGRGPVEHPGISCADCARDWTDADTAARRREDR